MNGIIIIDKPINCTSHDIVYKIKKIFNEKVGHTGTLDPLATGVLPILVGKATHCSKYLIDHDKTYQAEIKLGQKTETGDAEGKIILEKEIPSDSFSKENIVKILESFLGEVEQFPPIYSAIKVKGKKLYEYARNGEKVEIEPRRIKIYSIKLLEIDKNQGTVSFEVSCSKGTYIRSLCEDIAERLGTVGYMSNLRRIKVGRFSLKDSISLEDLEKNIDNVEYLNKYVIQMENLFEKKQNIHLDNRKLELFLNGVKLTYHLKNDVYKIYNSNNMFIGIGIVENNLLKRDIII